LIFLLVLVIQALDCRFWEAAVVSIVAVATLDYFFIEPRFTFAVASKLDGVTLFCLLAVSLIVTRIQASSRERAVESGRQRQSMQRLYDAAQELLALPPEAAVGTAMLRPFLRVFQMRAACIFDGETAESHLLGTMQGDLAARTRDAYIRGSDLEDRESQIVVRCLRMHGAIEGAIGFAGLADAQQTANALAALASSVLARARAFRRAADAAAQARAEMLRSAILDALAHEIKTPLAVITASAGGLRAAGDIGPAQAELAEMIETEGLRLSELTSSLLRVARLDKEEVKPRLETVDVSELARRAVRRYGKIWPERRIDLRRERDPAEVRADPELVLLAISQLVENACRYSQSDTSIAVDILARGGEVAITVANEGPPIPAAERQRIFERFFRGAEARRAGGGSGLGLFVTRKIARAHGGDLVLAEDDGARVTFRMTIPMAEQETVDAG
jgi:two-component system sensor histidine kinase KdpD